MTTERQGEESMETCRMFINGQALRGGPMHDALDGAQLLGEVRTKKSYRFFSFRNEFPGLHPVDSGGVAVLGELYALPYAMLRDRLLPREPAELELGVIELEDGRGSLAMRIRDSALGGAGVTDISDCASWLAYLETQSR